MKIKYFFFIILIIFKFSLTNAKINDKIIAKVGNEIITNYDIINEVNTILALSNKTANQSDFRDLKVIAFSSLKKNIIQSIEIKKYGINKFSETDLNNYISKLEQNLNLNNTSLEEQFKRYDANYKKFIDKTIVNLKWNTLIYSLYKKQLDIDEELIKSEINEQINQEKEIKEFNLSEIVVEEWSEEKLNKILRSIDSIGFEKTASLYSSAISSSQGGNIGWLPSSSISPIYLKEIIKLEKEKVSKPIKLNNNIILIKLNDIRTMNKNNLDVSKIEINVINKKKEEKLKIFSSSHYLDLEKKTFIEIND